MKEDYENLILDLCAAVQEEDAAGIMNSAAFEIDDVAFSLRFDKEAPEMMLVYADFGPMPAKRKMPVYMALLEENFVTAIGSTGSFSMSPATKRIIYITQVRLEGMTVEALADHLGLLADRAKEWRITHYIGDEPAAEPRQRGAGSLNLSVSR
jgi:hypothetical protein